MIVSDLLTLFRSEMADKETPYLWDDPEVLSYIDDAQKMFCRFTDGISDATNESVTLLELVSGDAWVDTHVSILKIRDAYRTDTGLPVDVLNREDMPKRGMKFDSKVGPLTALIVGMEANKVRVYPTLNEAVDVQLTVFRLPLDDITQNEDVFEIAPLHHRHLLKWVKHLAYAKHDAETYDQKKSAQYEQEFRQYCFDAMNEERRKRHKPRSVAYGGI